ncbi:hypothetical protein [Acetobacter cerevisiae]|uniref:Uncharacterized protein n=1 Tax=Acetobacter cerevisiae TaxID=178900 RepID=A0A149V6X6_9PROT|nr:hypothetical protein [Acetobacter cerevisiae]KXV75968.1 hypothetical protein AD954_13795 [Acetobacter cerevisiae]
MTRKKSIGPVYKRIILPSRYPFLRLNLKLQATLLATERLRRLELFKKQKLSAEKCYSNHDAQYKCSYDYINLHLMHEAYSQRHYRSALRSSGQCFLDFIDAFDFETSKDLAQQLDQEWPTCLLPNQVAQEKLDAIFRYRNERHFWASQMRTVRLERKLSHPDPAYPFRDYVTMRASLIEDGRAIIGLAMQIALRQSLHHTDIPLSWERLAHVFGYAAGEISRGRDPADYLIDASAPLLWKRGFTVPRKPSEKQVSYSTGRTQFMALKEYFLPVAPILGAMSVISSHPYIPQNPLDSRWPSYQSGPDGLLRGYRAGVSFMDDPDDELLTKATIIYALCFQQLLTRKATHERSKPLLLPQQIVTLESDLYPAEIEDMHRIVSRADGQVFLQEPLLGKDYKAQGLYAQELLHQVGTKNCASMLQKQSLEEPLQTSCPAMILPPLPRAIVDALRSYKDVNQKPQ